MEQIPAVSLSGGILKHVVFVHLPAAIVLFAAIDNTHTSVVAAACLLILVLTSGPLQLGRPAACRLRMRGRAPPRIQPIL